MTTITISEKEYKYLKRLERAAQDELLGSIERGLKDASKGKLKEH